MLRPLPFANCHIFSNSSLPWSVKYFIHGRKTFITRHSVTQRRSDLIIPRMRAAIVQPKSFAYVGPSDWTISAPAWNYYRCHISSRRDDLRLSCLLTQTPGASIPPETMMHFPPVSDSPLFQKNFRTF